MGRDEFGIIAAGRQEYTNLEFAVGALVTVQSYYIRIGATSGAYQLVIRLKRAAINTR